MNELDNRSLHSAVEANDLKTAELLLKEGINVYCKDEQGLTALHILLQKRLEIFDSLRSKSFNKDKQDSSNPIHKEIEENGRFISMLLQHKWFNLLNCTEDTKLLNFHAACTLTDSSIAERLSDQVSDINQSIGRDSSWYPGCTALHFAAHCNINIVMLLVTKGANLLIADVKNVTPLDISLKMFNIEEIRFVLNSMPAWKDSLFSDGKTSLVDYISCLQDPDSHKKFLQLMDKNVGVFLPKSSPFWSGWTILHIAVTLFSDLQCKMINDILSQGADVTVQDSQGSTPVHLAFRSKKWKILDLLLKNHKGIVNSLDGENLSHLHITAAVNNCQLAKKLLKTETTLDAAYIGKPLPTVKPGWTTLHTAVHTNHMLIAKSLLQGGANLLQTDSRGFTAVHILLLGTGRNVDKIAKTLLASDQLEERVVEGLGLSHLHVAAWTNDSVAIERLLDLGADIEATIGEDEELAQFEGCRPIHMAIMNHSKVEAFEVLLRRGADVFAKTIDGSSPLSELLTGAYDKKYLAVFVKVLWSNEKLQKRIVEQTGITLLHVCCYALELLEDEKTDELLEIEFDVNARVHDDSSIWSGFTPLHVVVAAALKTRESHRAYLITKLIDWLASNEADVTVSNAHGDTPVHMILKNKNLGIKRTALVLLMEHQRDLSVNPTDKFGMSHFHVACLLKMDEVVEEFLKNLTYVDVNQPIDSTGYDELARSTPLHLALSTTWANSFPDYHQRRVVDLLLERGADVHAVDAFGYTPVHQLCIADLSLSRRDVFSKFSIDKKSINRRALDGKTPIEVLLSENAPSKDIKYCIERGGRINSYNPVSDVGYMAIVMSKQKDPYRQNSDVILRMMVDLPDIIEVGDTGRNAIHNAVASYDCYDPYNRYVSLIKELVKLGCDIYQQDSQGRTALHLAVKFHNRDAIRALIECGADVNIVDSTGNSSFSCATNTNDCAIFVAHLRVLQLVGMPVSALNAKLFSTVLSERKLVYNWSNKNDVQRLLDDAIQIKMCDSGFTVREFLYGTGPVTSLKQADRDAVNSFFKLNDLAEFPTLKGILKLQHRNVLQRPSLVSPAKQALTKLLRFRLPDLCTEIVLAYLTNLDLKNMTTAAVTDAM